MHRLHSDSQKCVKTGGNEQLCKNRAAGCGYKQRARVLLNILHLSLQVGLGAAHAPVSCNVSKLLSFQDCKLPSGV